MDPAEVVAVLAALLGAFLAGRSAGTRSGGNGDADVVGLVTGSVRRAGDMAGAVAGHVVTTSADVGRHVASGGGDITALGADAGRGAAAGAGFGFIQFRAARHVRGRPRSSRAAVAAPASGAGEARGNVGSSSSADAPTTVLVTNGTRFHRAGCASVRGGSREVSRDEALAEGRVPCRACNP